jgi:DNA-binding IclR family transcriptional regulator
MKERAGIQSVEVGFTLLDALAKSTGPLMLRDLAASAGMSAAKAHRYLVSYQRLGLVTQDNASTRYDLGPAALQLGLASLSRLAPVQLARERMADLMHEIGHTVAIAVWGNQGPTIVHWQESPGALSVLRLGDVMPLLNSATGRCFAAFKPAELTAAMVKAELARLPKSPYADMPRNLNDVKSMLAEVRVQGIARVVDALLPGVVGLCAPVFDADGHLALGLVALGPSARFSAQWDGKPAHALRQAASALSVRLGHVG